MALSHYVESTADAPLYGKRGEPLSSLTIEDLVKRLASQTHQSSYAKRRQRVRAFILRDNLIPAAREHLHKQYATEIMREGTEANLTEALNPAADIVTRVCQVYRHGVRRHVVGLSKVKTKAVQQLYTEARIGTLGPDWNRYGYFVGPMFAVPQVRNDRMTVDTLLPHKREVVQDEDDPTGPPAAVAYKTASGNVAIVEAHQATEWRLEGAQVVRVLDKGGERSAGSEQALPFAGLRFDAPLDPDDWESASLHDRLADASIGVAAITAVMGFVRQTQNKWLLFLSGQLEKMAKGQSLADPETPISITTDQGRQVQLQAIDFNTPVAPFIEHIRILYAGAAESTGVPAMIAQDGAQIDLEFAYDGLSELRVEQITFAAQFELDLAIALICAAKDGRHPLYVAGKLPSVDEIRRSFRAEFGNMGRRFADPKEEREQWDFEIRHGLMSIADLLAKRFPYVDREELMDQIRATLEENAELWDMLASRNVGATDDGKAINGAQENGAKGPQERDKDKVTNNADSSAS